MSHAFSIRNAHRVTSSLLVQDSDPPKVRRVLWDPPRPQSAAATRHKKVSWLELFLDLVFVVMIAQLASVVEHGLAHDHGGAMEGAPLGLSESGSAVLSMVVLGGLVFNAWSNHTIFSSRFEGGDDLLGRLIMFGLMSGLIFTASGISDMSDTEAMGRFSRAYSAVMALEAALHWRLMYHNEDTRAPFWSIGVWLTACAGFYFVLGNTELSSSTYAMLLPLGQVGSVFMTRKNRVRRFSVSAEHLPERLGLITIIALGEIVAVVCVAGSEDVPFWGRFMGFGIVFSLFWLYFQREPDHSLTGSFTATAIYFTAHIPLIISATGTAAALAVVIEEWAEDPHETVPQPVAQTACICLAVCSLSQALLNVLLRHKEQQEIGIASRRRDVIMVVAVMGTPGMMAIGAAVPWKPAALIVFLFIISLYRLLGNIISYVVKERALAQCCASDLVHARTTDLDEDEDLDEHDDEVTPLNSAAFDQSAGRDADVLSQISSELAAATECVQAALAAAPEEGDTAALLKRVQGLLESADRLTGL